MQPAYWDRAGRELARGDAVMSGIIRAFPVISIECRGEPFMTLVRSIVGQQISVSAAASIWQRLMAEAPRMEPTQILAIGEARLRQCGLSVRKVEYVSDLARYFSRGRLRHTDWAGMSDDAVIADLTQVRGIGRWTAQMFLMFNLLRPDVLPLDDLGLRKAVSHYYFLGEKAPQESLLELAEGWRPWRSVATWYLWRSLEPIPVGY